MFVLTPPSAAISGPCLCYQCLSTSPRSRFTRAHKWFPLLLHLTQSRSERSYAATWPLSLAEEKKKKTPWDQTLDPGHYNCYALHRLNVIRASTSHIFHVCLTKQCGFICTHRHHPFRGDRKEGHTEKVFIMNTFNSRLREGVGTASSAHTIDVWMCVSQMKNTGFNAERGAHREAKQYTLYFLWLGPFLRHECIVFDEPIQQTHRHKETVL